MKNGVECSERGKEGSFGANKKNQVWSQSNWVHKIYQTQIQWNYLVVNLYETETAEHRVLYVDTGPLAKLLNWLYEAIFGHAYSMLRKEIGERR
jgi:hypothetical protein